MERERLLERTTALDMALKGKYADRPAKAVVARAQAFFDFLTYQPAKNEPASTAPVSSVI